MKKTFGFWNHTTFYSKWWWIMKFENFGIMRRPSWNKNGIQYNWRNRWRRNWNWRQLRDGWISRQINNSWWTGIDNNPGFDRNVHRIRIIMKWKSWRGSQNDRRGNIRWWQDRYNPAFFWSWNKNIICGLEFSFLIIFEIFNEVGARLSWRLRFRQGMDKFTLTISPSFGTYMYARWERKVDSDFV